VIPKLPQFLEVKVAPRSQEREWYVASMQFARTQLVRTNPFIAVEHLFPVWPGLRGLLEKELPKHLGFRQASHARDAVEPDYEWAKRVWAMAPTKGHQDAWEARFVLIMQALEPCFPVYDMEQFLRQNNRPAMNAMSYARLAELVQISDRECQALHYPTFMELWSHLLGIHHATI
jgi:hypothetical protein